MTRVGSEPTVGRIVIASELYHPDLTSTGYYVTALAEALATEGSVAVITGQPSYSARTDRVPRREIHRDVSIHRIRSLRLDRHHLVKRALNVGTFVASAGWALATTLGPSDVVVTVTNPPFLPFVALVAGRARSATTVLVVHDLYPEEAVAAGFLRPGSALHRSWARAARWMIRRFDQVVTVGRDQRDRIVEIRGTERGVAMIPNWAEIDEVFPDPGARTDFRRCHGIGDEEFVAMFAGNHGHLQDLDTLLDAAELLRDEPITFVFLGNGARRPWLEREVVERGLGKVLLLPAEPRSHQRRFLCGADATLVSLVPGVLGAAVPSRLYNSLAAGVPLVAVVQPGSEVARVIGEHDLGWVSISGDGRALAESLRAARRMDVRSRENLSRRCRAVAVSEYSLEGAAAAYRAVLRA